MIQFANLLLMRRLLLLITLACLWGLLGRADSSTTLAQMEPNAPEVFGAIDGSVVESSGQPASGVTVSAYKASGSSWPLHKTTLTDASGHYTLERMATGIYRIGFSDSAGRYREQYYGDTQNLYDATEIVVTANQITGIDATLPPLARIAGTLSVPSDSQMFDVAVSLYRRSDSGWSWHSDRRWFAPQERTLPFLFGQLESGAYYLRATGDLHWPTYAEYYTEYYNNAFSVGAATILSVTAGSTITDVQIGLGENPAGAILAGRVSSVAGVPLPAISVTAYQTATTRWDAVRTVQTDNGGNYQFRLLEPALYILHFRDEKQAYAPEYFNDAATLRAATPITLAPGATHDQVDAQLTPTGQISGVITLFDGSVPESASLYLYASPPTQDRLPTSYFVARGADGLLDYKLSGIVAGVYYLRAVVTYQALGLDEYYQDAATLPQATPITVLAGQTTGAIDLVVGDRATNATISGRVTDPDNRPLPDILVEATPTDGYLPFSAKTTLAGTYQITVTKPGTYTVRFSDAQNAYQAEYYDQADQQAAAKPIVVTAGGTRADVNAILTPLGQILGSVALYDGTRPPSLEFTLRRLEQGEWQSISSYPATVNQANDVRFAYQSLPPGLYRLGARLLNATEFTRTLYYSNTFDFDRATPITVTAGGTVSGIPLVLGEDSANSRLQGTVWANAMPMSGIKVEVHQRTASGWSLLVYVLTDAAGQFRVDGLQAGRYRVGFRQKFQLEDYDPPLFWGGGTEFDQASIIELGRTAVADASIDLRQPYRSFLPVVVR